MACKLFELPLLECSQAEFLKRFLEGPIACLVCHFQQELGMCAAQIGLPSIVHLSTADMTLSPTLIRPSKIHIAIVEINLGEVIFEEDWQSTCITQAMPSGADQTDLDLVRDLAGYARNAL